MDHSFLLEVGMVAIINNILSKAFLCGMWSQSFPLFIFSSFVFEL